MGGADGIVGEFLDLKRETEADLLLMQVGDFYEFFGEDAELAARELDLKVSEKSSHGSAYPMAGVPVDEVTPYVTALVERGYRVAIADQHETADGHARDVTRVVTPGTLLEATGAEAQYLATVVDAGDAYGLAFADVTTGRFHVTTVADVDGVLSECYRFGPAEVLPGPSLRDGTIVGRLREETDAAVSEFEPNAFAPGAASHAVRDQFGDDAAASLDLAEGAVRAAGAVLAYVEETDPAVRGAMTRLQPYHADDHVALDVTTRRNLELTETMTGGRDGSLVATIDHTESAAGGRLLAEWLGQPIRDRSELGRRLDAVAALADAAIAREAIRDTLGEAADLERLASRITHGSADARDLVRVADALGSMAAVRDRVAGSSAIAASPVATVLDRVDADRTRSIRARIDDALVAEPPGTLTEGGLFQRGYDDELDEVAEAHEAAVDWVDGLADRESRRLGITHLSVGRNRTDGYYLQVGKSEVDAVPDDYREIKTLKNSKRYTTDELEDREREILRLEERRHDLEHRLFEELREAIADDAALLQDAGRVLAEVDVLCSLASHAAANGWTRPAFVAEGVDIEGGRHPVVEQTTEFVPNDTALDADRRFQIVTGPNMSGKSTYLRQVGLIVLLAQVGSFVPADRAHISPVDGIFTRVGALDELAQGRSTFMVEMQELSNILHAATADSLVILDEVGRGTATYDGISIAWAATEYLANQVRPLTLFATHYHELTALADRLPGVHNVHVAAEERDGDVTFLRTVLDGPTDRSYGIHVADLAGVPAPVVDRAQDVLDRLRADEAIDVRGGSAGTQQVVFDLGAGGYRGTATADGGDREPLDPTTESVLEELRGTDLDELPPLELMQRVAEWQRRLRDP